MKYLSFCLLFLMVAGAAAQIATGDILVSRKTAGGMAQYQVSADVRDLLLSANAAAMLAELGLDPLVQLDNDGSGNGRIRLWDEDAGDWISFRAGPGRFVFPDIQASTFQGDGSAITGLNAGNLTSGTLGAARLPVPGTTTLGGVMRNAGTAGQYVTGINSSGELVFGTPAGGGIWALTGDVVATGPGSVGATIQVGAVTGPKVADDAIAYSKMQNVSAASRLLGRGSSGGAGDVQEITLGTGLEMNATQLRVQASGLSIDASQITGVLPSDRVRNGRALAVISEIVASGSGTTAVNQVWRNEQRLSYGTGERLTWFSANGAYVLNWDSGTSTWYLGVTGGANLWTSEDDVDYPWEITTWTTDTGTDPPPTFSKAAFADFVRASGGDFSVGSFTWPTFNQSTTGNAATATALQTARTINGVGFDGTANVTVQVPVSTGITGLGTGVATALGVNVGSAGAPVVNGGALGTPASGVLTNATGLPLASGVTGVLPRANGGTGLSVAGTAGNVLTSDGTNWVSSAPAAASYASQLQARQGLSSAVAISPDTLWSALQDSLFIADFSRFLSTTNTGSGSMLTTSQTPYPQTGPTANSSSRGQWITQAKSGASSWTTADFSRPSAFGLTLMVGSGGAVSTGLFRVWFGTDTNASSIAARGYGFEIRQHRVWIIAHNGTTLATQDTGVDISSTAFVLNVMRCVNDGAGGVSVFLNNAQIGTTLTGGPTTSGTGTLNILNLNGATAAANDIRTLAGTFIARFY